MIAAIVASSLAVVARFARRARTGHRVRTIAGVRLGPVALLWTAVSSDAARGVALGAVSGMAIGGAVPAVVGAALGAAAPALLRRRRVAASMRTSEAQIPEMLRSIAAAVRAGRSLPQALQAAHEEASEPLRSALEHAVGRFPAGASVDEVLGAFGRRVDAPSAWTAIETIMIGRAAGGDLPAVLDAAVEAMVERSRIERDRRAATSQARLSAVVVGAMPLVFFMMAGPTAREQLAFLFTEPVGWLVLALGLALQGAGALWMRSLMRPR